MLSTRLTFNLNDELWPGMVHCLKLSPNLRRQSKEVKTALLNKDLKKAGEMEIKKLEQLLGQVREPENDSDLETES